MDICNLMSSFVQEHNNEAIEYLVMNLAENAEIGILLDHCDMGNIQKSLISQHIKPKAIEVALSNYLSRIENSRNITDFEEYKAIEEKIIKIFESSGLGINSEENKHLFGPFIKRIEKINANKEIKTTDNTNENSEKHTVLIEKA